MLYADDVTIIARSIPDLSRTLEEFEESARNKDFIVDKNETEYMMTGRNQASRNVVHKSGKHFKSFKCLTTKRE